MSVKNKNLNSAAFFDLDLTITEVDSFRFFLKKFYLSDINRFLYLPKVSFYGVSRKLRLVTLKKFKEKALSGLKKLSRDQIKNIGNDFFYNDLKYRLRRTAIQKVVEHKKNGDLTFIISASPDIYVHAVSSYLGCDGYICTLFDYKNDVFTGKILGEDCLGKEKLIRVRELSINSLINLNTSYAYSDHESDLPLLKSVGNAIAVTPTFALKNEALLRCWPIEEWI